MTDWDLLETKLMKSVSTICYFNDDDKFDLRDDIRTGLAFLKREYITLSSHIWGDLETMEKRILRIYANPVLLAEKKREFCLQVFDLFMRRARVWSMNTKHY